MEELSEVSGISEVGMGEAAINLSPAAVPQRLYPSRLRGHLYEI